MLELGASHDGRWSAGATSLPSVDGCLHLDLEASAFTNALAVARLGLRAGARSTAHSLGLEYPGLAVRVAGGCNA